MKREAHPRAGQTGGRRRRSDGAGKTGSREQGDENEVGRTRELRIGVEAESRAQRGIARPENATPPEDCAIAHPLVFYPLVVAFHPGLPSSHSPVRGCPLGLAFLLLSIRDPRAHGLILRSDGVYKSVSSVSFVPAWVSTGLDRSLVHSLAEVSARPARISSLSRETRSSVKCAFSTSRARSLARSIARMAKLPRFLPSNGESIRRVNFEQ